MGRLFEASRESFERGDPGAWIESDAVSDDFEWVPAPTLVTTELEGRTVFRGREEFVDFFRHLDGAVRRIFLSGRTHNRCGR
jgi:hypothetical protein